MVAFIDIRLAPILHFSFYNMMKYNCVFLFQVEVVDEGLFVLFSNSGKE